MEKIESLKMTESESLKLAKKFLGKNVKVIMDRPKNSKHPKHKFNYDENYGYVDGIIAPDGEELDAYFLGVDESIESAQGICIAIVHRLKDDDDKLVVVPIGIELSDNEIEKKVKFQEQWFEHKIIR